MSAARRVLERLLRRAEGARLRGDPSASLSMQSVRDAGEYLNLSALDEFDAFHADIALAERAGAIAVQRDRRGDGSKLLRLRLADLAALALHLRVKPLDEAAAEAEALLAPWLSRFPIVDDVLRAWRQGRKVRGGDASSANDLRDAARAVAACGEDAGHERILRRESVRLFGDSKRLERLTPWLDLLLFGETTASGLVREDVWAALGLRREPQPLLLAGEGMLELDGDVRLPLIRPFLGVPVESLRAVTTSAQTVLSIENLASFHDAARLPRIAHALLLYTGGMPSPAWRAAYARILRALPAGTSVHHWGDIDEGGFRIAATLSAAAGEAGRRLQPWCMSPDDVGDATARATPSPASLAQMLRWARRAGWDELADDLQSRPVEIEQEAIAASVPSAQATDEVLSSNP